MSRGSRVWLEDILESIRRIDAFTEGMTVERFRSDLLAQDAVIRNLEVIGEAAKKIPESLRATHSSIPWPRVAGLRDLLIHEYFGIDLEIVWNVVGEHLPPLRDEVVRMLDEIRES